MWVSLHSLLFVYFSSVTLHTWSHTYNGTGPHFSIIPCGSAGCPCREVSLIRKQLCVQLCASLDLQAVSLTNYNMCTNLTQTVRMQLSLGKCVLCIYLVVARNTCFLSPNCFSASFRVAPSLLAEREWLVLLKVVCVCVCACMYVCKREREKVVCLCLCMHVCVYACVCYGPLDVGSNHVSSPTASAIEGFNCCCVLLHYCDKY